MNCLLALILLLFPLVNEDKTTVDALMQEHLEQLQRGDTTAFFSHYDNQYEDLRLSHSDKTDKEVLIETIGEIIDQADFKAHQSKSVLDCLEKDKKRIIDFQEAKTLGLLERMGSFAMEEGDIGVAYFWNGACFFQGEITRIFRKTDGEWKIVAGL